MIGTIPRQCWKIQRLTIGVVGLLDQTVPLPEMSWLHHKLHPHTPRPFAIPVAFQTRTYRLQLATLNSQLSTLPHPPHTTSANVRSVYLKYTMPGSNKANTITELMIMTPKSGLSFPSRAHRNPSMTPAMGLRL
jgi:hypothetical protein